MEATKLVLGGLSTLVTALALAQKTAHDHEHEATIPREAVVVLRSMEGHNVQGTLVLKQHGDSVKVTGKITGIEPGEHGFHIHEFGDLRDPAGKSVGDHFNPEGKKHGGPHDKERHAGDLGNIKADAQGVAEVDCTAEGLSLHHVIGRSIVVHEKADDLKSQPSGDAGARIGVGVIGLAELKKNPESKGR